MIDASLANNPSAHVLKRSQTMTVERLSLTEFRVTPSEPGKEIRIVRFHPEYEELSEQRYLAVGVFGPTEAPALKTVMVECFAETSKRGCPANINKVYCSHTHAAITQLLLDSLEEKEDESESEPT